MRTQAAVSALILLCARRMDQLCKVTAIGLSRATGCMQLTRAAVCQTGLGRIAIHGPQDPGLV